MKKTILMGLTIMSICLYLSCGKDDGPTEPEGVEITGFTPASGEVGTEVTINGKNFSATISENKVTFNGALATLASATETNLVAVVPENATSGAITVTVNGVSDLSDNDFTVLEPAATITGFTEGEWEWEDTVNITGTDFSPTGNTVLINGVEAEIVEESETVLVVTVPYGSRTGKITVTKANNGPSTESTQNLVIKHGKWTQIADFGGGIRRAATAFVLNGVPYVGLGTKDDETLYKDLWTYDPDLDVWTDTGFEFPGNGPPGCSNFVIDNKVYIADGYQEGVDPVQGIWSFDSSTFTEAGAFNGVARYLGVAFSINGKGYFGTGFTDAGEALAKDFWKYDPVDQVWTQKADVIMNNRAGSVGVSLNGKGYVGGGTFGGGAATDFWEYDPVEDVWEAKVDIGGENAPGRVYGSAFVINDKIYVGLGDDGGTTFLNDFWEYDPTTDEWVGIADFPGIGRMMATAFVLDGKVYVGNGYNDNSPTNSLADFWVLDLGN